MIDDRLQQIRRAHASARPTAANPAWLNTHGDLSFVLYELDKEIALNETARAALAVLDGLGEWIEKRRKAGIEVPT